MKSRARFLKKIYIGLIFVFMYAPIVLLIIQSFNKGSMPCLYVFDESAKVKYVVKNVNLPDNEVLKFLIE